MRNWIWHQKFGAEEAVSVSSYSTFQLDENNSLFQSCQKFISSFTTPKFKREKQKKIGFKYK